MVANNVLKALLDAPGISEVNYRSKGKFKS
jgi:hypothetical protein